MSETLEKKIEEFEQDGVVLLRNLFSLKWLKKLEKGVEDIMQNPSPISREYMKSRRGRFFTDHHMSKRNSIFYEFLMESPANKTAGKLLKSTKLNLVDEHLLVKEPGTDAPTYWHHDLPYFEISWEDFASFWIPLDDVTKETGAMKFVKGSHLWGKIYKPVTIGDGKEAEGAADFDGLVPNIDANTNDYNVQIYEMNRGDALFFHAATLHAAEPNRSKTIRRRALSLRYAGSNATFQPRTYVPSKQKTSKLKPGSPLSANEYPVVWKE